VGRFGFAVVQTCRFRARCAHHEKTSAIELPLAEVPQVDHRIRDGFESVVYFADVIESKQQAQWAGKTRNQLLVYASFYSDGGLQNLRR
jgi:hypothetical protein